MDRKKKTVIVLLFILCGCSRQRSAACTYYNGDDSLTLDLIAVNDDIRMIKVSEVFVLPPELLANGKFFSDLCKQFDPSCHVEDDKLVRRYSLAVERRYSLNATITSLEEKRFHCE